jgi:hypothetical protein
MLTAALGEDVRAETLEELAGKVVGKTFAAQIGTSKDGEYSRVVHDTIAPAPPEAAEVDHSDGDDPEEDFEEGIPF